ncbi:MAG: PLP-dependent aminotransferase family protein [Anaerolineae bacterium]|nr:PLP-dependent aminotransferase family protein [Anaerolineae bacterium]
MQLTLDRDSPVPLYRQIVYQIREMILSGKLPPGARLPAERSLAAALGVNRTTIVNAYQELRADGLVEAHVGRGTTVRSPTSSIQAEFSPPLSWPNLLALRARHLYNSSVQEIARLVAREGMIGLATGLPTSEMSPIVDLQQLVHGILGREGAWVLRDSPTEGLEPLREAIASWLALKGCAVSPRQVLVVSGSQQGLDLAARLLLEPGDAVIVEAPTYLGALQVFRMAGARLIGIPMDESGMRVDLLEPLLAHYRPRLIYTMPTFQNPTGATLIPERRERLLALAGRYQVPILEDDSYSDLYYDAPPPASLLAYDRHGVVLHLGSLSPALGPGLRLGWIVAPMPTLEPLTALKQVADLHPSTLIQVMALELLRSGQLAAHLGWARQVYARRRDAMEQALRRYMSATSSFPLLTWQTPHGGFYYWCRLPDGLRAWDVLHKAAHEGVVFVPGEIFFPDGEGAPFLRLNFSHPTEAQIEEGIRRLAQAIQRMCGPSLEAARSIQVAIRPVV